MQLKFCVTGFDSFVLDNLKFDLIFPFFVFITNLDGLETDGSYADG